MFETLRLQLALFILPAKYRITDASHARRITTHIRHVAVDHLRAGSHIRKRFTRLADELVRVIGASGTVSF